MRRFNHSILSCLLAHPSSSSLKRSCGTIDAGDVEIVSKDESFKFSQAHTHHQPIGGSFRDVASIDAFSRPRVLNFMRRYSKSSDNQLFEITEIRTNTDADCDEKTLYRARIRVPIPEFLDIYGEGVACNPKDAELLAAMHAEQIIDECGYHIYTLSTMQKKHAESARRAGRWAPMPQDGPRALEDITMPSPLRRILLGDETENGQWLLVDTRVNQFRPHPFAILSPCIFEPMSLHRIRSLFKSLFQSFEQHLSVREVDSPNKNDVKYFVATITLPPAVSSLRSPLKALGKATERHAATVLAAMHAELLLDAEGVCIFPKDPTMQKQHASAAKQYGRWAPSGQESVGSRPHGLNAPPGLKQVAVAEGSRRIAPRSTEEELVRYHDVLGKETSEFVVPRFTQRDSITILKKFLQLKKVSRWDAPFLHEKVGAVVKSTVALPIASHFGVRGGVGIGNTIAEADLLAAQHALDVLCTLQIDFLVDSDSRHGFVNERKTFGLLLPAEPNSTPAPSATPSPPGLRFEVGKAATSSTVVTEAPNAAERPNYKLFQSEKSRDLWDLKADFKDFIIVVAGSDEATFVHTLHSPRRIDQLAKDRIVTYLVGLGKRINDVQTTTMIAEGGAASPMWRTVIHLPVPTLFGDRLAVGEAADATESELLAAMHAELTLDALGVPIYADAAHQQKHAVTAARCGRRAPFPNEPCSPPGTPSPPHLRKPDAAELSWIQMVQSREKSAASDKCQSQQTAHSNEVVDDSIVPQHTHPIVTEELDQLSKLRVHYYLRRQKLSALPEFDVLYVPSRILHVGRLVLPVPKRFGERVAIGIAAGRKDCEILCYMHAERILDSLGIHIFNLPGLQRRHVERVLSQGRWAPLLSENISVAASTKTPLPLMVTEVLPRPSIPSPPSRNDVNDELWSKYVDACEFYIETVAKRHNHIAFIREQVPRTGDALIDSCLDEVDAQEVDNDAKQKLTHYCFHMNLCYPNHWKSRLVGPSSKRVCLTHVEVPGHEHLVASGIASNKETSQRRAVMHIFNILRKIEPDFVAYEQEVLSKGTTAATASTRRDKEMKGSYDNKNQSFTNDGKVRAVELYTVCFGLQPPMVLNKQRADGEYVTNITTVEITDEEGKQWIGRADDAGRRGNTTGAYDNLFQQLQQSAPGFSSLAELITSHPHLDPEHVVDVTFPDAIRLRMKRLIEERCRASGDSFDDTIDEAVAKLDVGKSLDPSAAGLTSKLAPIDKEEERYRSDELKRRLLAKLSSPDYQDKFAVKRKSLSIYDHKEQILKAIEHNQVTIICGTTGCGKTTQVPQFVLDDATERGLGGELSMIVTQPRRLSAVSIAQRISSERLEGIGDTCGYTIRLDSKPGKHINFVTSGVLLRLLHTSPSLEGINYVVIDEIHERDINSDFLLILVRDLIRQRKDLRVILMSATLSSDQFASFFGGAPVINVEGYVHPVREFFLDDLVEPAQSQGKMTPLLKEVQSAMIKATTSASSAEVVAPKTQKYGFLEATVEIDYLTLQYAIDFAMQQHDVADSSILVFLPGWDEIVKAKEFLSRSTKFHVITLHSSVSADEQMLCFQPPPPGKVKLILSTNIAESGVTIDDIAVVIDLGRAKEKSYVLRRGRTSYGKNDMGSMSQLVTVYASRANCVQRRGRVGRTRPGLCIRMYTKKHFAALHDFQTPEMLRQPLDSLCLQILALGLGDPVDFLRQAIEPPTMSHIESAMCRLHELGAVTSKGLLTPLGLHLAMLPVAPRVGKMILVGAVLKCLDSALTIAACSDTDVYNSNREVREAVKAHREDLSSNTFSDHISSVNGFNYWVTAHYTRPPQEVMFALQERLLSIPQLLTVSRYKRQFFDILCHHGFIPEAEQILADRKRDSSARGDIFVEKSTYSEDATHVGLVKCVVGAGLFPNVCLFRSQKSMRSKLENRLAPASSSVVAHSDEEYLSSPFFVYEEVVKQNFDVNVDRLVLRGVSSVPFWTVLLMGTSSMPVTYRDDLNIGIIDDWIIFRANFATLDLIRSFKRELNVLLTRKFTNPNDAENNQLLEEFRQIIKELTSTPLKPNGLVEKKWEERGTITAPVTVALPQSESLSSGDTSDAGLKPVAAVEAEE